MAWAAILARSEIGPRIRAQHKLGIRIKVVAVEVVEIEWLAVRIWSDRSETSDC